MSLIQYMVAEIDDGGLTPAEVLACIREEAAKDSPYERRGYAVRVLRIEQVAYFHPHPDGELP